MKTPSMTWLARRLGADEVKSCMFNHDGILGVCAWWSVDGIRFGYCVKRSLDTGEKDGRGWLIFRELARDDWEACIAELKLWRETRGEEKLRLLAAEAA
jgi:hypothetical protein